MQKQIFMCILVVSLLLGGVCFVSAYDLTEVGLKPNGSYDFGGETVTIISWTSERMEKFFNDNLVLMGRVAEAEELFNCKIDFMQTRDIPDVNFNRLLAGESGNDLWHVQNKIGYWELVAQGAVLPMSDILPEQYYESLPPSLISVEKALEYDGKYFGVGPVEWRPLYGYQNDMIFVAYNKTLFEREGLEDLYEVYLAGDWTWDKATELAKKITQDIDGDGIMDQWGMVDVRIWDLAVSNGSSITRVDENGRVIFTADEPGYIEALEQHKEWATDLQVLMTSGSAMDTFVNGQAGMFFYAGAWQLPDNVLPRMTDEWGLVPYPKGPRVDEHKWTVQALSTTLIPLNAKDPEALVALKSFLWREEDVTVGDLLATHVTSQDAADVFLTANNEWDGNASRLFQDYYATFDTDSREVTSGAKSASALMAELKPIIQANLDDLFSQ